jgi:hypothetical protein
MISILTFSVTPKHTETASVGVVNSPRSVAAERKEPLIKKRDIKISQDLQGSILENKPAEVTAQPKALDQNIKKKLTVPQSPKFATSRYKNVLEFANFL